MKVLIVGGGGIGSYLTKFIGEYLLKGLIDFNEVTIIIMDDDIVELKNLNHQNFEIEDLGNPKVDALKKYNVLTINERLTNSKQFIDYDMILCCVDNDTTRALIYLTCHDRGIEFIDIRSQGKRVFCSPKGISYEEDSKFLDLKDTTNYSCQEKKDLKNGQIQFTNRIAASIGFQMFLNYLRKAPNHKINFVV